MEPPFLSVIVFMAFVTIFSWLQHVGLAASCCLLLLAEARVSPSDPLLLRPQDPSGQGTPGAVDPPKRLTVSTFASIHEDTSKSGSSKVQFSPRI